MINETTSGRVWVCVCVLASAHFEITPFEDVYHPFYYFLLMRQYTRFLIFTTWWRRGTSNESIKIILNVKDVEKSANNTHYHLWHTHKMCMCIQVNQFVRLVDRSGYYLMKIFIVYMRVSILEHTNTIIPNHYPGNMILHICVICW